MRTPIPRPRIMGYRSALRWLIENDDCEWLDDAQPSPSVSAHLVASIYGQGTQKLIADLQRTRHKKG